MLDVTHQADIAVLRVLGLVRRQVGLAVAAQATTTAIIGAVVWYAIGEREERSSTSWNVSPGLGELYVSRRF